MKTRSGRICLLGIVATCMAFAFGPGEWTGLRTAQAQDRFARAPDARGTPASLGLVKRPPWNGSRIVGTPDPPSPYTVELAFPHLKFEFPLVMVPAPGTRRLFVGDLKGRIWSFPNDPECRKADLAVDLARSRADFSALYGLTFHPKFQQNRYVYLCYVLKNNVPDGTVVSRFEVSPTEPPTLDPRSEKVLLRFWSGGHNAGCLDFGNDG